jgi:hypothetical protein
MASLAFSPKTAVQAVARQFGIVTVPVAHRLGTHMRLQIAVDGDADETERLRQFLAEDVDVRRAGDLRYARPAEAGHLGVDIQVLSLAIGSTLTASGWVLNLLNFRRTRPGRPVITVTHERPDGTIVRIDSDEPDAVAEIIRKLENG